MYIYLITNKINGKYYVGKTKHKNLNSYLSVKRWAVKHKKAHNMPIVSAMIKYGIDNFTIDILNEPTSVEDLNNLEQLWIILLNSRDPNVGYNILPGGDLSRTGVPCREETKRKIGLANKGRKPKGYIRTDLHRQQLRDRMKGNNIGIKFTSESATQKALTMTIEERKERSKIMHEAKRKKKCLSGGSVLTTV